MAHLEGGLVDQDVHLAERLDCPLHDVLAVLGRGHVSPDEDGPSAAVLHAASGLLGLPVLAEVGDEDIGAFAGEGDRDCSPDAAVSSRHDGGRALEPAVPR